MNNDIILSPHFKLSEFLASETARKYGIANVPPPEAVVNLRLLSLYTLEPLREALGLPIIISSGYRSRELNELITHHSSSSQHVDGRASDFHVAPPTVNREPRTMNPTPTRRELLIRAFRQIITNDDIDFDQLIIYPTFIHVSYVSATANRHKLTRAFGNGKYCALTREEALNLV